MQHPSSRWVWYVGATSVALAAATAAVSLLARDAAWPALAVAVGGLSVLVGSTAAILYERLGRLEGQVTSRIESRTYGAEKRLFREIGAATALSMSPSGGLLPALDGMALSAQALHEYLRQIIDVEPRGILELGAGASTVFALRLVSGMDMAARIVAVDHDAAHLERVQRWCVHAGLDPGAVTWVHAPLTHWRDGTRWYEVAPIAAQGPFELVLVDGPPNPEGDGARSPTYEALRDQLAGGARLLVDDTDRVDEAEMVRRWLRSDGSLRMTVQDRRYSLLTFGDPSDRLRTSPVRR